MIIFSNLKAGLSRASENNAGLLAGGIAYYSFLALFPLLAAVALTYGLAVDPKTIAQDAAQLTASLPQSAAQVIKEQILSVTQADAHGNALGLAVSIALSLFGARVAAGAVIQALNVAFEAPENRGFIKANMLALAITIGGVLALGLMAGMTALVALVFGGTGGSWGTFAFTGLAGIAGAVIAYRTIPNRDGVHISHALRGAIPFGLGWMLASAAFGYYAANFGNYNATYGSLGAIVVLLTWLYLSAYLLVIGAHIAAASMARSAS